MYKETITNPYSNFLSLFRVDATLYVTAAHEGFQYAKYN